MKLRILNTLASLFVAACVATSCLDDDTVEYEYSSNASITAFAIADSILTDYQTILNGTDTTLTAVVIGADYPFVIDQNTGNIYNPDSLPMGTDVSKVVVDITSDNYVFVVAETDSVWEDTDSLDFRQPIQFKVISQKGTYGRVYTAKINVHQQEPDSMVWTRLEGNDFDCTLRRQKAVSYKGNIYVVGEKEDGKAYITSTAIDNGRDWTPSQCLPEVEKVDIASFCVWNGQLYLTADGQLYTSTDGQAWTKVETDGAIARLMGGIEMGTPKLVGADVAGQYLESGDATHWTVGGLLPEGFPARGTTSVAYALDTNPTLGRMVLIAHDDEAHTDSITAVWSLAAGEKNWTDISPMNEADACPWLENAALVRYDNQLYTFGGAGQDDGELEPFSVVYASSDNGITWAPITERVMFPDSFTSLYEQAEGEYSYIVDDLQRIWIIWSRTGEVWRGRINRLGFDRQ